MCRPVTGRVVERSTECHCRKSIVERGKLHDFIGFSTHAAEDEFPLAIYMVYNFILLHVDPFMSALFIPFTSTSKLIQKLLLDPVVVLHAHKSTESVSSCTTE